MKITILGPGCPSCLSLERATRDAVASLGIDAEIEIVSDYGAILGYGVMSTPALVIDGEVVVVGRVPRAGALRDLLAGAATPAP